VVIVCSEGKQKTIGLYFIFPEWLRLGKNPTTGIPPSMPKRCNWKSLGCFCWGGRV